LALQAGKKRPSKGRRRKKKRAPSAKKKAGGQKRNNQQTMPRKKKKKVTKKSWPEVSSREEKSISLTTLPLKLSNFRNAKQQKKYRKRRHQAREKVKPRKVRAAKSTCHWGPESLIKGIRNQSRKKQENPIFAQKGLPAAK